MSSSQSNPTIAFIGTGPITLLKAYLRAKKNPGSEIVLFDMMGDFGGAWYSDLSPEGHEIECGCHIWSYNPEVYQFMERELGIPLDYFRPTPLFVGSRLKVPYSTKNFIDSYKYLAKQFFTFRWKNLKVSDKPHVHWKLFGKRNKYPKTGSPELIRALQKKLEELDNVSIQRGVTLKEVVLSDRIELRSDEKVFEADQLYLTSVSKLERVVKGEQIIELNPRQVDYNHLLVQLNKPLNKAMTYWRLMNDPVVHRITDISYQAEHKERLLLAGIKGGAFNSKSREELVSHLRDLMKSLKLIDESHELTLIKTHHYPTYYSDAEAREKIAQLDERLKILHSTDLIYGLFYLLKEEKVI